MIGVLTAVGAVCSGLFGAVAKAVAWLLRNPLVLCLLVIAVLVWTVMIEHGGRTRARAALIDPATHRSWQAEQVATARTLVLSRADFRTCKANTDTLTASLDRESASLTALAAAGRRMASISAAALSAQRVAGETAAGAEQALRVQAPGPDHCASALSMLRSGP